MMTDPQRDEQPLQIVPAGWLSRARAQSIELAEARARRARPFRPEQMRQGRAGGLFVRHPFALVMASAMLLLLVVSGAWALVVRGKRTVEKSPRPAVESETRSMPAPVPRSAPAVVATPTSAPSPSAPVNPPSPVARSRRKEASRERPVAPPPSSEPLQRPDGDLILAPPHAKQPPLFSPEEWKRQRSQPRD